MSFIFGIVLVEGACMSEAVKENYIETSHVLSQKGKSGIAYHAIIQAFFTAISRVCGMIRDVMVSHIFGAGIITDSFFIAFTIPNVLRQFFAEGAFSVAFVPIYIETKDTNKKTAKKFYSDSFGLLLVFLSSVTILGVLLSKHLVKLFAMGFSSNSYQLVLADNMTKILFPYIFLVSIVAIFGARLACYKKFAAMAAAPILLNISMIIALASWSKYFLQPIYALSLSVLIGGVAQVMMMSFILLRSNLWAWPTFSVDSVAMKKFFAMLGPSLFGVFVYQLNIIVLRQLASFLGEGQISYYYNADRITQFATGVFTISIATAALPELSRVLKKGEAAFKDTLDFTLSLTSFVIVPCAFGIAAFALPIVSVLFFHGAFTLSDTTITAKTLVAFSPSLLAFGFSRTIIQAFYAMKDTRTPVFVGAITVLLNLLVGIMLLSFDVVGLAATLSISSWAQFIILFFLFKRKVLGFKSKIFSHTMRHVIISIFICVLGLLLSQFGEWGSGFSLFNAAFLFFLGLLCGVSYLLFSYILGLKEGVKIMSIIEKKVFRR